ncbi:MULTISPECIES: L,D-transpeptidase family protein [Streptomyces]|uniref:L,D-transpeptidase family protein n=1 Tax=Streptomyces katrae TaxID=68223 RepID=A0ABT7H1R7_9ACTN|nr:MULTISPECIES: L,D-transpeptidase family protein [Streptomyces]MDK9499841.1 L,D-transpeptidase family protein [Streptomyces katrae]GLX18004.1 lipoprotein [Streptomyces lavendulae subsp. lavendulae]GLX26348.1 lipoprotein [Streptomyces lavendulae subsp. lavendulae]
MHRQKAFIRTLGLAAAVAFAATACGPQGAGAGPAAPSAPAGGSPSASPSKQDDKPGSPSPSAPGSPSAPAAPGAKPLMANGDESEQVRELQARLRQLKLVSTAPTAFYGSKTTAAVKTFQSQHGLSATGSVDEATWQKVQGLTKKPTDDELRPPTTNEVDAPDPRCMQGRVMCISKESRTLAWMIDGKVVSTMDVRFGSENTPTREGLFQVEWKAKEWTSTIYHTSMPYSMFFSQGQAVHYSSDFAARGYDGASHGCVNVRDKKKLSELFDQVKVGDKVVVYW